MEPIPIDQTSVLAKMTKYLEIKGRDKSMLPDKEHSNGFAFLAQYYRAFGKGDEYYRVLTLLSGWDGSEEGLFDDKAKNALKNISGDYNDLEELFEHWINDVVWFQAVQEERSSQFNIVRKDPSTRIEPITNVRIPAHKASIKEFLDSMIEKEGTVLEFGGGKYASSAFIEANQRIKYYDPNMPLELPPFTSTEELAELMFLTMYSSNPKCHMCAYKFVKT